MKKTVILLALLAGCELRGGLTRSQLYGGEADAAVPPDLVVAPAPDLRADPPDAASVEVAIAPDAGPAVDKPVAPPNGILVTGAVRGICDNRQVMIGGAGYHTCSYAGKGSYTLRIRGVPPGTKVEIVAKAPGYLPSPATVEMVLEQDGNTHNFDFTPATGSCDTVPDAGPCVCALPSCEPS